MVWGPALWHNKLSATYYMTLHRVPSSSPGKGIQVGPSTRSPATHVTNSHGDAGSMFLAWSKPSCYGVNHQKKDPLHPFYIYKTIFGINK